MIKINNLSDCTGCSACASICAKNAIIMSEDREGFIYPKVDLDKCVDCVLCEKVCPVKNRDANSHNVHVMDFYAARNCDKDILFKSSSGGMFYALAKMIIKENGIVVGAKYDENLNVIHYIAESLDECKQLMGSKYAQSKIGHIYKDIKQNLVKGRKVLFTGTPCQVHGLKLFLRKQYPNLLCCDLVCHAVPSPLIFKDYKSYVEELYHKRLKDISMRDKAKRGWSHDFSYVFNFVDGKRVRDSKKIANWGKLFFSRFINRPSCYHCRYSNMDRVGDLTIADYWDDSHRRDDIYSKEGTSLVIINTEKGKSAWEQINSNLLYWNLSEADAIQPCLLRPTPEPEDRSVFWSFYFKYGFIKTYHKFFHVPYWKIVKKKILDKLHIYKLVLLKYFKG